MGNVRPLLGRQRKLQLSARVTVTPANLVLRETLEQLISEGFHSVGFSPLLSAPSPPRARCSPKIWSRCWGS